jgi:hypothetical protein
MLQKCERFWSFVNSIKPFFLRTERDCITINGTVQSILHEDPWILQKLAQTHTKVLASSTLSTTFGLHSPPPEQSSKP